MAKTYEDIVTESRELLKDTDTDVQRYSNSDLINILNRGLQALGRIRPDAFYDLYSVSDLNIPELVETSPGAGQTIFTAVFGLELQFFNPLVSYLVGIAEVFDDEYTTDGRAAMLLTQFRNTVLGI